MKEEKVFSPSIHDEIDKKLGEKLIESIQDLVVREPLGTLQVFNIQKNLTQLMAYRKLVMDFNHFKSQMKEG